MTATYDGRLRWSAKARRRARAMFRAPAQRTLEGWL